MRVSLGRAAFILCFSRSAGCVCVCVQEVHVSLSRVGTRWLIDDVGRAAI